VIFYLTEVAESTRLGTHIEKSCEVLVE